MVPANHKWLLAVLLVASALSAEAAYGGALQRGGATAQTPQQARPAWRVRVNSSAPVTVSLRAVDALMIEIAAEIGRQLGVTVALSPLMQKQRVSLEFNKYPLEAALNMLAPQAYVDYVTGENSPLRPKCVTIYLQAYNEAPPPFPKGNSIALLVEGDTEATANDTESTAPKTEPNLVVSYDKKLLSVRAQKQPLLVVLYEIAVRVGIPFEIESHSVELVSTSFHSYPLDQAISSLSPAARLYFRTNTQTLETTPLRIVLAAPLKN